MSSVEKKTMDTQDETASTAEGAKPAGKEEEAIPTLELVAVSKNGGTPSDVAGSLKIPMEDSADLTLCPEGKKGVPFVDIVSRAEQPSDDRWQVKWHVWVSLSNDDLLKAAVVKEKVYQKYVCINALLSFHVDVSGQSGRLASGQTNRGEWLFPIKVTKPSDSKAKLLAYVKVKIEDQTDEPAKEPEKKATAA